MPIKLSAVTKFGEPEVPPQSRAEKRREFVEQHTRQIEEIMHWAGLPQNRSEILALAGATPIGRKPNHRFALTVCPFGLEGGEIIQIAARALIELDEFHKRAGKFNAYAGGNDFDWAFQVGATIAELNSNVEDWMARKEPAREWLKQKIIGLLSTNRIGHSYVKKIRSLLQERGFIEVSSGTRASASSDSARSMIISWRPNGGEKTGVAWEAFRKIARAAKTEYERQSRLGRG